MSTEPAPWPEWQRPEYPAYETGEEQTRGRRSWMLLMIGAGLVALTVLVLWRMRASRRQHTLADRLAEGMPARQIAATAGRKGMDAGRTVVEQVAHSDLADRVQHPKRGRRLPFGPLRRH